MYTKRGKALRKPAAQHPDRVPGPVHLAQPAHDGRRHHRRAVRHPPRGRAARATAAGRCRSCSTSSASTPSTSTAIRTSSPAASASASASPAGSRSTRRSSSATSRSPRSTSRCRRRSINLLEKLQDEFGLSYIFIAHDLSVVRHISDRVAVMYLGKIAEIGKDERDLRPPDPPLHPGAAVGGPGAGPDAARPAGADHPRRATCRRPANPPSGCRFRTRCWKAQDKCTTDVPLLEPRPDGAAGHLSACHFAAPREIIETIDLTALDQHTQTAGA